MRNGNMIGKTDILHPFAVLAPEVRAELHGLLRVQTFAEGEQLFLQGAPTSDFYIIAEGRVKVTRVTPQGHENILCVRGPGQFLCPVTTLDGGTQLGTGEALTDTMVLRAERDSLAALCQEHLELLAIVVQSCLCEVRHLVRRLEILAFQTVRERLIRMLLMHTLRQGRDAPADEVRLTQQELGAMIGASRESVSRTLAELERKGMVSLGRGRVVIRDRKGLARLVGEADQ